MNFADSEQRQESGTCYLSQLVMTGNERYIQKENQSIPASRACRSYFAISPRTIMNNAGLQFFL
jgi:hypothetical protein